MVDVVFGLPCLLGAVCFLVPVSGVVFVSLFKLLRFWKLVFFSRLYLSSTGLVSVSDEYNLEKPSQNISKNVVFENIKN